jgi:hypothetical protein
VLIFVVTGKALLNILLLLDTSSAETVLRKQAESLATILQNTLAWIKTHGKDKFFVSEDTKKQESRMGLAAFAADTVIFLSFPLLGW